LPVLEKKKKNRGQIGEKNPKKQTDVVFLSIRLCPKNSGTLFELASTVYSITTGYLYKHYIYNLRGIIPNSNWVSWCCFGGFTKEVGF
jgi:hypothetical protein